MPKMWVISKSGSVKVEIFEAEKKEDHKHFNDQDEAAKGIKSDPKFDKEKDLIVSVVE